MQAAHPAAVAAAAAQQQQHAALCEPGQVLQLLLAALSHDQALQKQAEQSLQALEPHPGYISCLAVGRRDLWARSAPGSFP
jgi:hypothetical protein